MSALARKAADFENWEAKLPTRPNLALIAGGKFNQVAGLRVPLHGSSPVAFVTICGAFLIMALAAVLVLNTAVVNRSYEMARLQNKVQVVNQDVQSKQEQLRRAQASLPAQAHELGMVAVDTLQIVDVSKYAAEIANQMLGDVGARG